MGERAGGRVDADGELVSGRLHRCSVCSKEEPWGQAWRWYGSYKQIEDGEPVFKACSEACLAQHKDWEVRRYTEAHAATLDREIEELEHRAAVLRKNRAAIPAPAEEQTPP